MTDEEEEISAIRAGNWRQGCLLPDELAAEVTWAARNAQPPSGARFVVITHSCDLVNDDFEKEPVAEVVAGLRISEPDPTLTHAKNPRRLDLEIAEVGGQRSFLRLDVRLRGTVDRRSLARHAAGARVADRDQRTLESWLTGRYGRPPLPDAFNGRLRPYRRKIRQILKKAQNGQPLAVFLALGKHATVELPEDASYPLVLYVVLEGESEPGDEEREAFERDVYEPLVELFGAVEGVELKNHQLVTENDVTWREVRVLFRPLDLEYLTNEQVA